MPRCIWEGCGSQSRGWGRDRRCSRSVRSNGAAGWLDTIQRFLVVGIIGNFQTAFTFMDRIRKRLTLLRRKFSSGVMKAKSVVLCGIAGGALIEIVMLASSAIAGAFFPYDVLSLGGMRSSNDPVMALFFAWPFVFAFAAAIAFGTVEDALEGTVFVRGSSFGALLILLYTIPSFFVVFTSMDYPFGFYLSNLLLGLVGFPLLGILFVRFWKC